MFDPRIRRFAPTPLQPIAALGTGVHIYEKLYLVPPDRRNSMSLTATFEPAPALRLVAWSGTFRVSRWLSTMDAMTLDRWVPFRNERAAIRCRLFAFPHAGGNAAFYRPLRRFMPPEVDLCPVELPGRAARLDEPPFVSMSALMEELRHALQPLMAVPFGFFGHSVGSWMAYEAARQLRSLDGRTAIHLFVSGRRSPDLAPAPSLPPRPRSDHELLAILDRFGGTPAAIMEHPELLAALLPALRADLALADGYSVDPEYHIDCPITALGGADDPSESGGIQSWKEFTRGKFRTRLFPGGHFYISTAAEALTGEFVQDLHATLGMSTPGARPQL
jgi:medium-chain acyl-[acyl-carrier-protein] hydrolase